MATTVSDAKRRLLDHLKCAGPCTAGELAAALGLTTMAIRQHLQALRRQDLVERRPQPPSGRGRPTAHWALTEASMALYPDRNGELAAGLLDAARQAFGEEGVRRLLARRAEAQIGAYRRSLPAADAPLGERVAALARRRTAEGYMAESKADGDGGFLLIEHHCPICEAAKACVGLCAAELEVFQQALGPTATVERTHHLLQDGDRCVYRIRETAATPD